MTDFFAYGAGILIASGLVLVIASVSAASMSVPTMLGLRGLRRAHARETQAWFRIAEPLVRWTAARIAALPLGATRTRVSARLEAAGDPLGLSADEWIGLAVVAAALTGVAAAFMVLVSGATALLIVVGPIGAYMAVFVSLDSTALRRQRTIVRGLPTAIDLIALCTSAGLTFHQAIGEVLSAWPRGDDPLADELRLMQRQLALGNARREVLAELARRVPTPEVFDFSAAVTQAEAKGTPLREVLSIQATVMRQRQSFDAEERSSKAAMKMLVPLVLLLAATFIIVLAPVLLNLRQWM